MSAAKKATTVGAFLLALLIGAWVYETEASRETAAALAVAERSQERAQQAAQQLQAKVETAGKRLADLHTRIDEREKTGGTAATSSPGAVSSADAPVADPAPDKTAFVQQLFAAAAEGRIDPELFEPRLAADVAAIKGRWIQTMTGQGNVVSVEFVDQGRRKGNMVYRHRIVFERGTLLFESGFGAEGKMNHIAFRNE